MRGPSTKDATTKGLSKDARDRRMNIAEALLSALKARGALSTTLARYVEGFRKKREQTAKA